MSDTDPNGILACEHGRQRRKCEVCRLIATERELESMTADRDRLASDLATATANFKTLVADSCKEHTAMQELCLASGIPAAKVNGDSHGVPGTMDLADMLAAKLAAAVAEREELRKALGKAMLTHVGLCKLLARGMPMTTEELDELERKAKAATPGERVKIGSTVVPEHSNQGHWENDPPDWVEWMSNGSYKKMHEDMIFIAACDPQTILSLIAAARENESLRERVKELEGELATVNEVLAGEREDAKEWQDAEVERTKLVEAIRKDAKKAIREAIGEALWNQYWGPELERLGSVVYAVWVERLKAESDLAAAVKEREEAYEALRLLNELGSRLNLDAIHGEYADGFRRAAALLSRRTQPAATGGTG